VFPKPIMVSQWENFLLRDYLLCVS
jgi:hypothetical protein